MDEGKFVWVVYSTYEHCGGSPPEAIFGSLKEAKKYKKDNDDDGWYDIAKFDLTTGKPVCKDGKYTK